MIRQTLVQKNGDIYVFLTDEEQEINRAIEAQNVDSSEVTAKVSEMIFDDLYAENKYRHPDFNGRYAFAFNKVVDDKHIKQISIMILHLKSSHQIAMKELKNT